MKKTATFLFITSALCFAAALPALAEMDAAAWGKAQSEWNKLFKTNPATDMMQNIAKGKFPDQVSVIARSSGQDVLNQTESAVKEIEAQLLAIAEQKLAVLEVMRNADDPKALKLLATTMKIAAADLAGLKKTETELREKLAAHMKKNMTKTDKGYSGSTEALEEKNRLEICIAIVPPFVTHCLSLKRSALAGFSGAKSQKAVEWVLNEAVKDKDWEVRVGAVEAMAEIRDMRAFDALVKALEDKEPAVRVAAISGLQARGAKEAKGPILNCLKDASWEVRTSALEAVLAFDFKDADTISALVDGIKKEEGRLNDDFDKILSMLTGKSFYGDAELWGKWWEAEKPKWVARDAAAAGSGDGGGDGGEPGAAIPPPPPPPPAQGHKGPGATSSFYGIETKSHNIIYILDCSGSMAEKANLASMPEGAKGPVVTGGPGEKRDPGAPDPGDRPQGDTRLDVLKWQLKRSIGMLPVKASFNVIFYNHEFEVFSETMMLATPANKKKVFDYIDGKSAEGKTNIFDPVERAFLMASPAGPKAGGAGDPRYGGGSNMGGADTFYLLSDGSPNAGRIPDPEGIITEVRKINSTRKVVIHTVVVGGGFNPQFMETLAKENGGKCVVVK